MSTYALMRRPTTRPPTEVKDPPHRRPARSAQATARADFPHAHRIQSGLGTTIPGTWSVDPAACRSVGAEAFTTGTHSVFASPTPRLRVAAHEAAHQVQHHGGTRDGFLGAEGHAEAVAHRLERGGSARDLLGPRGLRVAPETRPYVQLFAPDLAGARLPPGIRGASSIKVAESGEALTVVEDGKVLYATPATVAAANARLRAQGAGVWLRLKGSPLAAQSLPGVALRSLRRVEPVFRGDPSGLLPHDCGQAARELTGPWRENRALQGVCTGEGGTTETAPSDDSRAMRASILEQAGLGTGQAALDSYRQMDDDAADAFDAKHGLNRHAAPKVGQTYTVAEKSTGADSYSFHWAFVILQAARDRITLENSAASSTDSPEVRNDAWVFEMYGPANKYDQTYHAEWEPTFGGRHEGAMTLTAGPVADEHASLDLPQVLAMIGAAEFSLDLAVAITKLSPDDQLAIHDLLRRMHQLDPTSPRGAAARQFHVHLARLLQRSVAASGPQP